MLAYVGESSDQQMDVMKEKDKRGLPFPFGVSEVRRQRIFRLTDRVLSVSDSDQASPTFCTLLTPVSFNTLSFGRSFQSLGLSVKPSTYCAL